MEAAGQYRMERSPVGVVAGRSVDQHGRGSQAGRAPVAAVGLGGRAGYYVRQLWDMKGSMQLEAMSGADLVQYGRLCGWVLARGHARSGDAAAISGYLGTGDRFDGAVADFAEAYADQTETDYAEFLRAGEGLTAPGPGRSGGTNQRKGAEG